jgi:hypothetical protein
MQPTTPPIPIPPRTQTKLFKQLCQVIGNPATYSEIINHLKLRHYQEEVVYAILKSFLDKLGFSFVVMFPRQSGKNECQAQLESYLLTICSGLNINIVKISPTWKPQSENAMDRLENILKNNFLIRDFLTWQKESGYIYRVGQSRCIFMSGSPTSNIVGQTANLLLEVDEAQDVDISKFDKEIAPMAASTNCTKVFWGTAWTSQTLLGRELRAARQAEKADGIRRVFTLDADQVALEVPAYGKYVAEQINKLGRNHPMIRTQYFSEEIDAQAGMFPPTRRALMIGGHPAQDRPPGGLIAFLIDCAGQDEAKRQGLATLENEGRDATALTIVQADLTHLALMQSPTYRTLFRKTWTGDSPVNVFGQIRALVESWNARYIVIDATGVGEGLAALLDKAFPGRVIFVKFTQQEKSELGWQYISIIETGRWCEYAPFDQALERQLDYCQMEILPGPAKTLRWGVPDGTRATADGLLVHDDLIVSNALSAKLDQLPWAIANPTKIIQPPDYLKSIEGQY